MLPTKTECKDPPSDNDCGGKKMISVDVNKGFTGSSQGATTVQPMPTTAAGCGNKRQRKTPQRFNDYVMGQEMENLAPHSYALLPTGLAESVKEALQDSNGKAAMDREYESLTSNKVWTLVKRVKGKQPIATGW